MTAKATTLEAALEAQGRELASLKAEMRLVRQKLGLTDLGARAGHTLREDQYFSDRDHRILEWHHLVKQPDSPIGLLTTRRELSPGEKSAGILLSTDGNHDLSFQFQIGYRAGNTAEIVCSATMSMLGTFKTLRFPIEPPLHGSSGGDLAGAPLSWGYMTSDDYPFWLHNKRGEIVQIVRGGLYWCIQFRRCAACWQPPVELKC